MDAHPVRLVVTDDLRRSRPTVFFRLLLALPHLVWFSAWTFFVALLWLVAWVAGIATGRIPAGLHDMFRMYVRYSVQLGAYVGLAANPFPGFTGTRDYPVDVVVPDQLERQSRRSLGFRFLLALPALVLAGTLGIGLGAGSSGAAAVCAFLGWFAALALGRMPAGLRNLAAYGLGYSAQAYAYGLFLTDRYPNADPEALGPERELAPHPVELALADDGRRSRLTVLFRLLLALPHLVWLTLWTAAVVVGAAVSWVLVLARGRSADALHRFGTAYVRYSTHVYAFTFLVANPFPGFVGAPGFPVEVRISPPAAQSRWTALLRLFLVLPAVLLGAVLELVLTVLAVLGWFAALALGRMPPGLRNLGAVCLRYRAQWLAYVLLLTGAYPHATPALRTAAAAAEAAS